MSILLARPVVSWRDGLELVPARPHKPFTPVRVRLPQVENAMAEELEDAIKENAVGPTGSRPDR